MPIQVTNSCAISFNPGKIGHAVPKILYTIKQKFQKMFFRTFLQNHQIVQR